MIRAMSANSPNVRYINNINKMTAAKPIIAAIFPALIESAPKSGPTDRSSNIINGAGSAPALRSIANSFASSDVKPPDIWPEPPRIASLITGALTTLSSSIIAKGFPTFCCVTLPNFLAPIPSKRKVTIGSFVCGSNPGCAST